MARRATNVLMMERRAYATWGACLLTIGALGCRGPKDLARRVDETFPRSGKLEAHSRGARGAEPLERDETTAPAGAPTPAQTSSPTPSAPPAAPARVERIRVPGDVLASMVRGETDRPPTTIFLPGLCSNANAYLQAFPSAARRQGGVVALEGDQPCGALEGFRSFSWDASKLNARIEAAAAAAGLTAVPREGLTLVGYSQGAALGEQLVQRWPNRYARVVLIGAPTDPSAARFKEARAVVTMSCARDVPWKMKEATSRFVRAGIPSTYLEMPDCTHGNITDGDRTFDAAFDWLRTHALPTKEDAQAQPLVGALEG